MKVKDLSKMTVNKVLEVYSNYTLANASLEEKRNDWAIILKQEGKTYYFANDKTYLSDRRHVIVAPMGSCYRWFCEKKGGVSVIKFEGNLKGDDIFAFSVTNFSEIQSIFKKMEIARILMPDLYEMEWRKGVYEILMSILRQHLKPTFVSSGAVEKIQPAMEYIATNYHTKITNEILSAQCKISNVYFQKLFTGILGISPRMYVLQVRMDIAKRMLQLGDYRKIEDVAHQVGYTDVCLTL